MLNWIGNLLIRLILDSFLCQWIIENYVYQTNVSNYIERNKEPKKANVLKSVSYECYESAFLKNIIYFFLIRKEENSIEVLCTLFIIYQVKGWVNIPVN